MSKPIACQFFEYCGFVLGGVDRLLHAADPEQAKRLPAMRESVLVFLQVFGANVRQTEMRLQKYLAMCGVASRRAAEKMISDGRVTVDGVTITEMGVSVEDGQTIRVDGSPVQPETEKHYIMYHKPAGEVTTVTDP